MQRNDRPARKLRRPSLFAGGEPLVFAAILLIGAASAVVIKEFASRASGPALAAIDDQPVEPEFGPLVDLNITDPLVEQGAANAGPAITLAPTPSAPTATPAAKATAQNGSKALSQRWFNGRAIRPVKTITMLVTAYSPDEKSCAGSADGITASLHHVATNAHKMVAADTRVLPLGSMITIPGYDSGQVVPVLDRGGAIKGNRLDVLFPTDAEARKWGVRRLKVTVWEYADGKPATNWRAVRDSKN